MAKTYTPIANTTLTTSGTIVFSSIPSTYTDLRLIINWGTATLGSTVSARFNGDTASNYSDTVLYANGSTIASGRHSNDTAVNIGSATGGINNPFESLATLDIMNYTNTSTYKTVLIRNGSASINSSYPATEIVASLWRSTTAVTSITLFSAGTLIAGTNATLYGILKA